ncbi:MAG TPA: lysylphosphatidylglycerol synthase transmembrane domain-containing protein [Candidatus Sumerlaeota bacterium]|nr:lysylphosphatidylglycerol synthase transmembrane domain-containing protein [Candidatus Sumerlaeota bacterium]
MKPERSSVAVSTSSPSRRKWILGIVSVCVSGGLVAWLVSRMDLAAARTTLQNARTAWLGAAFCFTALMPILATVRWLGVLRAQEVSRHFPPAHALRAVMMANVLNSLLPSKAGDLIKAVYLRQHGGLTVGVGTVVLERLVDLGVLGALGLVGALVSGVPWGLVTGLVLTGGVAVVLTILGLGVFPGKRWFPRKIVNLVDSTSEVFRKWGADPIAVAMTVGGSLLHWNLAGLTVCSLVAAFGGGVGWAHAYSIFPLALLAGLVPATMSGVGTRDMAFVQLLQSSLPLEQATLVGLGYTLFNYWLLSLICLPIVGLEIVRLWKTGSGWVEAGQTSGRVS